MTTTQEVVERFAGFGLPQNEAEVFFHLSALQQGKASEVARAAGKRRPDVYPVLERLADKGLVQRSCDRPTIYVPVSIDRAVARLMEQERLRLDRLDQEAQTLRMQWPAARAEAQAPPARMAMHQGLTQIQAILRERLRECTAEACFIMNIGLLQRLGIQEALERLAERGVTVRLLTSLDAPRDLENLHPSRIQVRHLRLPGHLETIVLDAKEILLFVSAGRADSIRGSEESLLWMQSADVGLANQAMFDRLWMDAAPIVTDSDKLPVVETPRVEVMRGRWVRMLRLRLMAHGATHRIVVRAPRTELLRWQTTELAELMRAKRAAGVAVAVYSDGPIAWIESETAPLPACVIVHADEQVLVAFGGAGEDLVDGSEWAIWSDHRALASLLTVLPSKRHLGTVTGQRAIVG
jgi:sugar-specific transcriptional regulator TrmB